MRGQRRIATVGALMPRVAVVIPCYNDGATLPDALTSLAAQEPCELVVVDDGSDDPTTLRLFTELEAHGTRIVHEENRGVAAARMTGVAATNAPYVFPLDADDAIVPDVLTSLADLLDANAQAAAAWGDVQTFGDRSVYWARSPNLDPWEVSYVNDLPVAALFRRDALLATGGWQLRGGYEDSPVALRTDQAADPSHDPTPDQRAPRASRHALMRRGIIQPARGRRTSC